MGALVAIVGRPNVGKSTLFNRLTQSRQAIVAEEAGTTRDRQYGRVHWNGREFSIVDTGGWVVNSEDVFEEEINKQVYIAVEEADVVLFVADNQTGVTSLDEQVAEILRRSKKPVIVVANKVDNTEDHYSASEFYSFGLGDPYCIAAVSGSGTGFARQGDGAIAGRERTIGFGRNTPSNSHRRPPQCREKLLAECLHRRGQAYRDGYCRHDKGLYIH